MFRSGMIALGASAVLATAPAAAKQVEASTFEYKNNGAYSADFYVEYQRTYDGETVTCRVHEKTNDLVKAGGRRTIDLTSSNLIVKKGSKKACLTDSGAVPLSTEVWGYIQISQGEHQRCRKSTAIVFSGSGGAVKYRSGGTTYNNNRCKVSSWP